MAVYNLDNITQLQTLSGHTGDVTTCDFAPNFTLITGSSDKTIRIWDWCPGSGYSERPTSPLHVHKYPVTCVKVSPQGAMFASASVDGTATIWSLRTTTRLHTMVQVNGDAIRVCRFSPDSSSLITAGDNGAICIWDLIHRGLIRNVFKHDDSVQCLTFTPDSLLLVSACSLGIFHVWDMENLTDCTSDSPKPVASIDNAHDLGVLSCDIARYIRVEDDNPLTKIYTLATCGNDHNIKIWSISHTVVPKNYDQLNVVNVKLVTEINGHRSAITSLQFSTNYFYLVSSSLDRKIKIWNVSGCCLATLDNHAKYVNCVCFSRDTSLLVSGSTDKSIIVWDLANNLTLNSELLKPAVHLNNIFTQRNSIQENQVVQYAESEDDDVKLIEMIDDISDGAINSCQFFGKDILATASRKSVTCLRNLLEGFSSDKLIKLFHVLEDSDALEETQFSPFEGHTFPVNCIDFTKDGSRLASCSLDGATIIWNTQTGEQVTNIPKNNLSVRVCKYSSTGKMLITAGDDEIAYIWNADNMNLITSLEGHVDSIVCACFTTDDNLIVTVCSNGDFRLWMSYGSCVYVQSDAHDLGVQSCDFSQNPEPVPTVCSIKNSVYLLATCGNDSLVKLWCVVRPKVHKIGPSSVVQVNLWRTLVGHGGNVTSVKFSPVTSEIICSTASDRQARLWSVYSSECLHVLEHDSMTISCSFSANTSILAVGCLDKTLWLWRLPQKLIFQTSVARKMKNQRKTLINWNTTDISNWAKEIGMENIAVRITESCLSGEKLLTLSEDKICEILNLDLEQSETLIKEIHWLKQCELNPMFETSSKEIPEAFLCPITHEIMRTPVTCSDGFTYEKQAITEWFLSGKYTSPMTNEKLLNTDYVINHELKSSIIQFFM